MADATRFVRIEDSYVNPAAVALVMPDPGDHAHGIQLRAPSPDRCLIVTVSGFKVAVGQSLELTVAALEGAEGGSDG